MNKLTDYFNSVDDFFSKSDFELSNHCELCNGEKYSHYWKHTDVLIQCSSCGLVRLHRQPSNESLDAFYKNSIAMTKWADIKQGDMERQNAKYGFFWDFIGENNIKSVCDVGCGNGVFLSGLPTGIETIGVEPNVDAARHCKSLVVTKEELKDYEPCEFMSMFGVLEHLKNPLTEVKSYQKYLAPGGYFAIIVPNLNSLAFKIIKENNCTICPQHLTYFSIETLQLLMKKADFTLVDYTTKESEFTPITKSIIGLPPYADLDGIPLSNPYIKETDILKHNLGAKILAIFRAN